MLSTKPDHSSRRYLTVADVAGLYRITERSVYSSVERGLLRPVRVEGLRRVLFRATDVARLAK